MKKKKKITDQFVLIYWKDAALHGSEQLTRKEAIKHCGLVKGISGGILVNETKEHITLASDWFHVNDDFRDINSYPKSGIYKLVRYKFGKTKPIRRSR
jgi:hypothetical protein